MHFSLKINAGNMCLSYEHSTAGTLYMYIVLMQCTWHSLSQNIKHLKFVNAHSVFGTNSKIN